MASDKFLKRLLNIKSNPIANSLYNAFNSRLEIDKDLSQNWIDVTDKDDTVSFMGDRNANKIIGSEEDTSTVFSAKGRNEIKVGRLARAILNELGEKPTDKDLEVFVNTYKASKDNAFKNFKMVSGVDIRKSYLCDNYAKDTGTLGGSCMKDEDCQKYFKIYTKNPECCQLLVYYDDNGGILGRALVWKLYKADLNEECDAQFFMDRVYTANDSDIIKFTNYALQNGWLYKWTMTAGDIESLIFKYNGRVLYGRISVKLNRCHFQKYPFVDTLRFCNGDNIISNVGFTVNEEDDDSDEQFMMDNTNGSTDECDSCNNTGYEDFGSECGKCQGGGEIDCPECRGRGGEICKKCDGDGDILCKKCNGDGELDCAVCNGRGDISCKSCNGDGYRNCESCNGRGNMGECKKCNGECDIACPTCKGESVICRLCKGSGDNGGRTCKECDGDGRGTSGTKKQTGCRCPECSVTNPWDNDWTNRGFITCPECEGLGNKPCKSCEGKEGYGDPGQIECGKCEGSGTEKCPNEKCSYGIVNCVECDGTGNFGQCKECDGDGIIGDCKNPECDDGEIECPVCKGTGERPEGAEKPLCKECAGLLDRLKEELKTGEFKIK